MSNKNETAEAQNFVRARNAEPALQAYWKETSGADVDGIHGTPSEQAELLTDLLTDLRHWARAEEVDFQRCSDMAETHFNCELDEENQDDDDDERGDRP